MQPASRVLVKMMLALVLVVAAQAPAAAWGVNQRAGQSLDHGSLPTHPSTVAPSGPVSPQLDIKPGACPNRLNRRSHAVLPVALVGTAEFDVTTIDVSSVLLARADGVGGQAAPMAGPRGPHAAFKDVATPLAPQPCDCDVDEDGECTPQDLQFVLDCIGQAPTGLCERADITCTVDGADLDAVICRMGGDPPEQCCGPCAGGLDCCDVNEDAQCDTLDLLTVLDCLDLAPTGDCERADINCAIAPADAFALDCLLAGGAPEDCCTSCGAACDCHDLRHDGIDDLSMKFKTDVVTEALQLNDLPAGATVELIVTGHLLDGTQFEASDCVTLVPRGR
ncbi:MAG: hypothetical protein ACYS7M_13505 [Planctomycetota bacterium]|jgi:hypothetical protein